MIEFAQILGELAFNAALMAIVLGPWLWIALTVATKGRPYWSEIKALFSGRER